MYNLIASSFFIILILLFGFINASGQVRNDCKCGEANVRTSGRIINGVRTHPHKYPWISAMFTQKTLVCGGSIISDRNIITAGHCVFYIPDIYNTYWVLGMHNRLLIDGEHFSVESVAIHPYFKNLTAYDDYDMAMITVRGQISFNEHIMPICLSLPLTDYTDKKLIVAGWGRIDTEKDIMSDILQETRVTVQKPEVCRDLVSRIVKYNDESMLCAKDKGTDSCNGDSGGPLFIETDPNRYELVGVVSFGDGCAQDFPGIYGKLTNYQTQIWIKSYMLETHSNICSDSANKITNNFFDDVYFS